MIRSIRNLSYSRLSTAVMILSVLMIVVGTLAVPGESSPVWVMLVWIAASLALIGVFVTAFYELIRRFFAEDREI